MSTCPPQSLTAPLGPQAIAHEIYTELVEDACLGLCFEVHRAVKCGYFFLDDTDPDSMKDFGEPPKAPRVRVTLVTGHSQAPAPREAVGDWWSPHTGTWV